MPECLWVYESKDFGPLIVSIDTHGGNLTESVNKKVIANRDRLISEVT
jgi:tartrate dehydratase beta subunit/fumarate hydratase class I family protein